MLHKVILLLFFTLFTSTAAKASDGVLKDKIIFGQSAVLNGPASALGQGVQHGILAAFKEANDKGGVKGRTLHLHSLNDGYEPTLAIVNAQKLIHEENVFALIGGVGTPTANAILPIITKEKVPFIAPFTGAQILRKPFNKYVVNVRASYAQEIDKWVKHLTKKLHIKKIAVFYQEDMFGLAGLADIEKAIQQHHLDLVAKGTFKRNTLAVKRAVIAIKQAQPEAILMIGTYQPSARFIKLSKELGSKAVFLNLSFVGSRALKKELGSNTKNVIISQVVPLPFDQNIPLIQAYQKALSTYNADLEYDFTSLEGYIAGRLAIEALHKLEGELTREAFLETLYAQESFTIDNIKLKYTPDKNQGSNKVYLTTFNKEGELTLIKEPNKAVKK